MQVQQIYSLMNTVTNEVLGNSAVVQEDLSNVVDIGNAVFNSNAVDNYVKSLVNHIGKVIFVNRPYFGSAPSVIMDSWEFGSVLEKVSAELPTAVENSSWDLTDNTEYSPNVFHKPVVTAKFYNKKVTFEIDISFTERQVKESFSTPEQLNGFLSMIFNAVDKAMTIKVDGLIQRTINNMIGETVWAEYKNTAETAIEGLQTGSGIRAVNLLYLYNEGKSAADKITVADAMTDKEFIKFAIKEMNLYADRLKKISKLFNIGGQARFTPTDMLHVVMLTDLKAAAGVYLQADTYHDNYVMLPKAETVPYWQASGAAYDFDSVSKIHVNTSQNKEIELDGILAIMFDRDALGVTNLDRRVTTNYNAKAEFYNNFYKFDAGYFNDFNENFVVFFIK